MNKFAPLSPKVAALHGADYNPSNGRIIPVLLKRYCHDAAGKM